MYEKGNEKWMLECNMKSEKKTKIVSDTVIWGKKGDDDVVVVDNGVWYNLVAIINIINSGL